MLETLGAGSRTKSVSRARGRPDRPGHVWAQFAVSVLAERKEKIRTGAQEVSKTGSRSA